MPAVQHARPAARPAGRQRGGSCANTAAATRHREPGVADSHTQIHPPPPSSSHLYRYTTGMTLWTKRRNRGSRADTHKNCDSSAIAVSVTLVHKRISLLSVPTDNPPCS